VTAGPDLGVVVELFAQGCRWVAGLDEVGRGAWAGPVVVVVAAICPDMVPSIPPGVRDSKLLSASAREALFDSLAAWCPTYATGEATPAECDELGMTAAQALAANRALARLGVEPDALLVDGSHDYTGHRAARTLVGGDATCSLIAAASVLAKVLRDRMMIAHDGNYPGYHFAQNKGYVSAEHRRAVRRLGLSPLHRRSWSVAVGEDDGPSPSSGSSRL
jgi:ribonuclease HII